MGSRSCRFSRVDGFSRSTVSERFGVEPIFYPAVVRRNPISQQGKVTAGAVQYCSCVLSKLLTSIQRRESSPVEGFRKEKPRCLEQPAALPGAALNLLQMGTLGSVRVSWLCVF
jgi:hypothetical protein